MSSVVPKHIAKNIHKGKIPQSFMDVDKNVQFICRIIKIYLGDLKIGGSHFRGYPSLDSDIDLLVDNYDLRNENNLRIVEEIGKLFNVRIDLTVGSEGFDVN